MGADEIIISATRIDRNSIDYYTRAWIYQPSIYLSDYDNSNIADIYDSFRDFLRVAIFWEWSYGLSTHRQETSDINTIDYRVVRGLSNTNQVYDLSQNSWSLQFGFRTTGDFTGNQSITTNLSPQTIQFDLSGSGGSSSVVTLTLDDTIKHVEAVRQLLHDHPSLDIYSSWNTCLLYTSPSPRDH